MNNSNYKPGDILITHKENLTHFRNSDGDPFWKKGFVFEIIGGLSTDGDFIFKSLSCPKYKWGDRASYELVVANCTRASELMLLLYK